MDEDEAARRAELAAYGTNRLWSVVYAKLNRSGRPADTAGRDEVISWIVEFEYRGLHRMDWPPKDEGNE